MPVLIALHVNTATPAALAAYVPLRKHKRQLHQSQSNQDLSRKITAANVKRLQRRELGVQGLQDPAVTVGSTEGNIKILKLQSCHCGIWIPLNPAKTTFRFFISI
jgi:hypothetical protein